MRLTVLLITAALAAHADPKPNVVFVLADQWRAQATGYAGDPNLRGKTPVLDRLAAESVNFRNAVSCTPVCTPYRASLLTGQYPLRHGLFLNDAPLGTAATSIAQAFAAAGYDTAYIGKWHVDGHGRTAHIPEARRQGFAYWKALECAHDYNRSPHYAQDDTQRRIWDGYDAFAQTKDAQSYIAARGRDAKPFLLVLSWGPPHNPYDTAPAAYRQMFDPAAITLRPNAKDTPAYRKDLAGYYAHIAALDASLGDLLKTIDAAGIRGNTLFVFTSDHGDMLGSHDAIRKQKPWDESIRVPLLIRLPGAPAPGRALGMPINTPDLMPTLLGLCGIPAPATVEGDDFSAVVRGGRPEPQGHAALIACYTPFGEWGVRQGGREYRGVRTPRHTYVRDLNGPWMLFDNHADPYQLTNIVNRVASADLQQRLDGDLRCLLERTGDDFRPGAEYIRKWGYAVDATGTLPTD